MVTEKELANFTSVWKRVTEADGEVTVPYAEEKRKAEPVLVSENRGMSRAVRFLPDF